MEVSREKNRPKHFPTYKMGSNTPTLRNHGLGQIFPHTHPPKKRERKKKKSDSVASLELGVLVKVSETGGEGASLHTLKDGDEG